jgi:hypothetical protein
VPLRQLAHMLCCTHAWRLCFRNSNIALQPWVAHLPLVAGLPGVDMAQHDPGCWQTATAAALSMIHARGLAMHVSTLCLRQELRHFCYEWSFLCCIL